MLRSVTQRALESAALLLSVVVLVPRAAAAEHSTSEAQPSPASNVMAAQVMHYRGAAEQQTPALFRKTDRLVLRHVLSNQRLVPAAWPEYEQVCEGECELRLAPGTYRFGLATSGATSLIPIERQYELHEGDVLVGSVDRKTELHVAGWTLAGLGIIGGIVLVAMTVPRPGHQPDPGVVTAGVVGVAAVTALGIILGFYPPSAELKQLRKAVN